jgi:hypothetical protein
MEAITAVHEKNQADNKKTEGDADGQTHDIDKGKDFVFTDVPQSDHRIVLGHHDVSVQRIQQEGGDGSKCLNPIPELHICFSVIRESLAIFLF